MVAKILDCTLRDGGYYTQWDFPDALVDAYFDAMAAAPVDTVEIGYRSPPKDGYFGQYFYLPRRIIERARERLAPHQKIAIMFNEKDVPAELAPELLGDVVGLVDTIRFAAAPTALPGAKSLASACKSLGFSVAINVMYLNKYVNDTSFLATLADADADLVALVDSYGSCTPDEVRRAIASTCALLPQPVGFHGHDNISLAFANALAAIEAGATVVDATMQGMGRGAGNLSTEVIATYLGMKYDAPLDFGKLAQASSLFGDLKQQFGWGSNLAYLISGFAGLPQADVMDWFATRRYALDSIVQALRQQGGGDIDAQELPTVQSSEALSQHRGRPVVILGGGQSVPDHLPAILDFVRQEGAVLVHSSTRHAALLNDQLTPQVYCLAGQELQRMPVASRAMFDVAGRAVVVPPAPRFPQSTPQGGSVHQLAAAPHSSRQQLGPIADEAPLDLALAAAAELGAPAVYLAGFDGYAVASLADRQNASDVQSALDSAAGVWPDKSIVSITPTQYKVRQTSVYGLLRNDLRAAAE